MRLIALGLFALGWLVALPGAFLPLWFRQFALDDRAAANCFLVLALGVLTALLAGGRIFRGACGIVQRALVAAGILGAAGLLGLAWASSPSRLLPPLFLAGLSAGGLSGAIVGLFRGVPPASARTSNLLNLAGACLGAGSVAVCLLQWLGLNRADPPVLAVLAAVPPAITSLFAARSRWLRYIPERVFSFSLSGRTLLQPITALLALSLLVQSAGYWVAGGWLALFLTRTQGVGAATGVLGLTLYWVALAGSRVAATRLPPLEQRLRSLPLAIAAAVVGGVFLLRTADLSGAMAGSLLLGAGAGLIYPLTIAMTASRLRGGDPGLLESLIVFTSLSGLLAPWLIGFLTDLLGMEVVIWFVLAGSAVVFLLLSAVFVESKLTSQGVAVE